MLEPVNLSKTVLLSVLVVIGFSACSKSEPPIDPGTETPTAGAGCAVVKKVTLNVTNGCVSEDLRSAEDYSMLSQPVNLATAGQDLAIDPPVIDNVCLRNVECVCTNRACSNRPGEWDCTGPENGNCPLTSPGQLPPQWAISNEIQSAQCCPGSIGSCPIEGGSIPCGIDGPPEPPIHQ